MKILQVELENFVCYYGTQSIDLAPQPGKPVVIVHGDNGYGKTSLFRAISWCLFSKQNRRGFDPNSLLNWDARKEGKSPCSVKVLFEVDGRTYHASRWYELNIFNGTEKISLEQFSCVADDGKTISEEDFGILLARVFPYEVSTLFLFDGEQLQTYEDLVEDDRPQQSAQLREKLEMVLGVPVLQAARTAAATARDRLDQTYQTAVAQEANDSATRSDLENAKNDIQRIDGLIAQNNNELQKAQGELRRVQRDLMGLEAAQKLVGEQLAAKDALGAVSERLAIAYAKRAEATTPLYIEVARPLLADTAGEFRRLDKEAKGGHTLVLKLTGQSELLTDVLADGKCVCSAQMDVPRRAFVQSRLDGVNDERARVPEVSKQTLPWGWIADQIEDALTIDHWSEYQVAESDVSHLVVERRDLEARIHGVDVALQSSEQGRIRQLADEQAGFARSAEHLSNEIRRLEGELGQAKSRQKELQAKVLRSLSTSDNVKVEGRRLEVAKEAAEAFEEAIEQLRQIKRKDVERAASGAFVEMRWKPDFAGLKIQKGYGLVIQTAQGEDIPARSAGEGQIVALSLLAGLNRCANVRAPIIMDTPFGRLDRVHRSRVLRYLAKMGDQIVLLATLGRTRRDRHERNQGRLSNGMADSIHPGRSVHA